MKMMRYKNFSATVEYDPLDNIYVGHLTDIQDIVGFHGENIQELETSFHEAVEHYIEVSHQIDQAGQSRHTPCRTEAGLLTY